MVQIHDHGRAPRVEVLVHRGRLPWWLAVPRWVLRHPRTVAAVVVWLWLSAVFGGERVECAVLSLVAVLAVWRLAYPGSFATHVGWRLAAWVRCWWVYRRDWQPVMAMHGLVPVRDGLEVVPRVRVRCGRDGDELTVGMVPGQVPADWEGAAEGLAHAWGARSCRVRVSGPGVVALELLHVDRLAEPVPALPIADEVDLTALPVGQTERGAPWLLRLLGTHVLVAGVTGAGKGSVLWSILRALCPEIRAGRVQVWALDPKGGMELGPGKRLFTRFAPGGYEDMLALLDDAVALMRERAGRLAGTTRQHVPTVAEPLVLVLVDEVANLTAYLPDRKLRERFAAALSLLLSQGRAVGVNVVAALQDPRKEVLGFRNLFPTKVALRLDEPSQVDMVLGEGARRMGAVCDRIPDALPGVGFVRVDGVREPVRVRAGYVSDLDIAAMCRDFAPRSAGRGWREAA